MWTPRSCGRTSMLLAPVKGGSAGFGPAGAMVGTQDGEAIGRSRGGLTTKIHLAVDGRGRPLSILLTPGQAGDNPQLLPLLDAIRVKGSGLGRPRKRPDMLIADKAYAHDHPPVGRYVAAGSATPSPNAATRSPAALPKAASADDHLPSTPTSTRRETSWNAASTASNTGATWPPDTPNAPASTAPASSSSPPSPGSDDRQDTT